MKPAGGWRRGLGWVLSGLLFYLVFLIVTIPAHWAGVLLERAGAGRVTLANPTGRLWQGAGTLVLGGNGAAGYRLDVRWELLPIWLAIGQLRAELNAVQDDRGHAELMLSPGRLQLNHLQAELPASALAALYSPAALIGPTGNFNLSSDELVFRRDGVAGEARLTWYQAGGRFGGVGEIGDYLLLLQGQNDHVALRVETLRGDARIDAHGDWKLTEGGMLQLNGTLASETPGAALGPLTGLLNARQEGDHYRFTVSTRLPAPWMK